MAKDRQKREIKDEPGTEERFKRGIERALETPPRPQGDMKKGAGQPNPKKQPAGKGKPAR
jgi:hypothetical protein